MSGLATEDATRETSGLDQARSVAFVFQGGGSLSAPQVGMLGALREAGIAPDFVIGTSAGALNAVAFASDPSATGLRRLENLWLTLRRRHVAGISARMLVRAVLGRTDGLFDAAPLGQLLRTDLVASALDRTRIPAHVVATELHTGATGRPLLGRHRVGICSPPRRSPVSTPRCRATGCGWSTAASRPTSPCCKPKRSARRSASCSRLPDPDDRQAPLRGPLAMAYHALGQILESTARRDSLAARGQVHLLPPAISAATNPLDFRETARLIHDGYELAAGWLASNAWDVGDASRAAFA